MDLGGFRGGPRATIAHHSPAPTLGCTTETGSVRPGSCLLASILPALRRVLPFVGPTNRSRSLLHLPTPPEVSVPSGDVTAGVRSSREYHSRHLPPVTFLRSSTACSSNGSPVVFRTGTTYGIQRTRTICCTPRSPSRSNLADSPVMNHEASTPCVPEDNSTAPSTDP
jgi:hypothetical protein